MKDEEMAEEWVRTKHNILKDCLSACVRAEHKNEIQAFLAGLKAGRPQWHDLRENPNDLPKDNNEVLVYMWDSYYIGYFNLDSWHFENFSEGTEQADAWCEIPTFDKE